jgi:hypothetical protein
MVDIVKLNPLFHHLFNGPKESIKAALAGIELSNSHWF